MALHKVLVDFLGISKCVLVPVTQLQYLGMVVDSIAQVFCIPEDKKIKFAHLGEQILLCESTVTLKSLQRLIGKCVSFRQLNSILGKWWWQ